MSRVSIFLSGLAASRAVGRVHSSFSWRGHLVWEDKRGGIGCGCTSNDRVAFKLVLTEAARSVHTQTWMKKAAAAQIGTNSVTFSNAGFIQIDLIREVLRSL